MAMTEEERKERKKERNKKYAQSEKGKEKRKEYNKKYLKTEKGKAANKRRRKKKTELAKNTNDIFLKSYLRKNSAKREIEKQEASLKTATKKGKWTQEEIDFLLTSKLTLFDKAIYLKRSYISVFQKQAKLKKDAQS